MPVNRNECWGVRARPVSCSRPRTCPSGSPMTETKTTMIWIFGCPSLSQQEWMMRTCWREHFYFPLKPSDSDDLIPHFSHPAEKHVPISVEDKRLNGRVNFGQRNHRIMLWSRRTLDRKDEGVIFLVHLWLVTMTRRFPQHFSTYVLIRKKIYTLECIALVSYC